MQKVHFKKYMLTMKILMVCLGNICRSPLAQGILEEKIRSHQLEWEIDSAGTSSWHVGEKPDPRSVKTANKNGLDITSQKARQFARQDFSKFDLIYAMDQSNLENIRDMATNQEEISKAKLILAEIPGRSELNVPDPYWDNRFDDVFEMLSKACDHIILKYSK